LFQPKNPALVAVCLFQLLYSAERLPRCPVGCLGRHSVPLVLLFQHRDVQCNLPLQFRI
jgi:hypothetical protein